jgi:hypothetical protein
MLAAAVDCSARRNREPPHQALLAMADESPDQKSPIESAKPIIAQCRREIAAGWTQVEAARAELKRTRVLHERWSELMQAAAAAAAAAAATASEELSHDRPRSEGFVMVPALKRNRNRRRSASG